MSDDTKALVRSTALRLFRERGYAATTMRAIAQEAGPTEREIADQHLFVQIRVSVGRLQGGGDEVRVPRIVPAVGAHVGLLRGRRQGQRLQAVGRRRRGGGMGARRTHIGRIDQSTGELCRRVPLVSSRRAAERFWGLWDPLGR